MKRRWHERTSRTETGIEFKLKFLEIEDQWRKYNKLYEGIETKGDAQRNMFIQCSYNATVMIHFWQDRSREQNWKEASLAVLLTFTQRKNEHLQNYKPLAFAGFKLVRGHRLSGSGLTAWRGCVPKARLELSCWIGLYNNCLQRLAVNWRTRIHTCVCSTTKHKGMMCRVSACGWYGCVSATFRYSSIVLCPQGNGTCMEWRKCVRICLCFRFAVLCMRDTTHKLLQTQKTCTHTHGLQTAMANLRHN